MAELELVGLSEDRQYLVLADASGQEFTIRVDDRLRAALRGDHARLGQLEIEMESALRPRDIQARIRSGDSPEDVAQVAQVPVDRIMGFAIPVLAERRHIAERAQHAGVRRKGGEGPSRLLGEAVAERLGSRGIDPAGAEWDSWRRDDGKWTVSVSYHSGERERLATFLFDPLGRYSVAADDDARWLVSEPTPKTGPQPRAKGGRRLAAVGEEPPSGGLVDVDDDLTALSDTLSEVAADESPEQPQTADLEAADFEAADFEAGSGAPDAADDNEPVVPGAHGSQDTEPADTEPADTESGEEPADGAADQGSDDDGDSGPPAKRRSRKSKGRASMPSWDEIMFGRTKE